MAAANYSVFVKFETHEDASACILALNGASIGQRPIQAYWALVQICARTANGGTCDVKDCMKLHPPIVEADVVGKEVDLASAALKNELHLKLPPDYYNLPKKSACYAIFPEPRLVPPTPYPFLYRNLYASDRLSLMDIATRRNRPLPAPKPTAGQGQGEVSLSSILQLAPRVK
jgi:hypothetical protein